MREVYVKIIYALDDYAREENLDNEIKKDKVLEMVSILASEEFFRFVSVDELYASVFSKSLSLVLITWRSI